MSDIREQMTWIFVLSAYGYSYGEPASETSVYLRLSIVLAVVAGTVGAVLAVQAWRRFRGAPFGRSLAILPAFMGLFTLFHAVLVVTPDAPMAIEVIESVAFVLLVAFMALTVRLHFRMSRRSPTDGPEPNLPAEEGR